MTKIIMSITEAGEAIPLIKIKTKKKEYSENKKELLEIKNMITEINELREGLEYKVEETL